MVPKKVTDTEVKVGVVEPVGTSSITVKSSLPAFDISTDELTAPVPEDREECFKAICSDIISAMRHTTLRFWMVGRTIQTMLDRGEKDVLEEVMERTGYEKRTIQYTIAVYKAVQDPETVKQLCTKGTEWSHFKELIKIKDESSRKLLVNSIIDGTVKPSVVLSPEIAPKTETKAKEVKKEKAVKAPSVKDPAAFLFESFTAPSQSLRELLKEAMVEFPNYVELVSDETRVSKAGYDKFMASAKEFIEEGDALIAQIKAVQQVYNKTLFEG